MRKTCIDSPVKTPEGDEWATTFKELAQLMYAVLRSCPKLPLLATSALNPRRPSDHLYLIDRLKELETRVTGDGNNGWLRRFIKAYDLGLIYWMARRWAFLLRKAVRYTLTNIYLKLRFGSFLKPIRRQPATVVMTTWTPEIEDLDTSDDFFYGKLPLLLQERGVSCLLLYNDWWDQKGTEFIRALLTRKHVRSVPERMLVPFWAPLVTAWKQILASISLCRLARLSTDKKFAVICREACLSCVGLQTMWDTLNFYSAREAVKTWHAKAFVVAYEGQASDKPYWHGVKAANKDCVTVGYQHTAIHPHSLALTWPNRGSWELASPDVVLCLGQVTRDMMKPGHEPLGTKLVVFGSFRRALSRSLQRPPKSERHTVLVIPEGRESEMLFNFAMRAAPLLPDHRFVFRCHPARPFSRVRPRLEGTPEELPNIDISDRQSLVDDCARSSVVLYRASSAVMVALLAGLKPIYLHDNQRPDVDPLFELTSWCECVSSPSQMERVLRLYEATPEAHALKEWRSAAEYVNAYTMPVDDASIDRFLEAVGLIGSRITEQDPTQYWVSKNMTTCETLTVSKAH